MQLRMLCSLIARLLLQKTATAEEAQAAPRRWGLVPSLGWSLLKQGRSAEAMRELRELRELLSIQPRHGLAKQGLDLLQATR